MQKTLNRLFGRKALTTVVTASVVAALAGVSAAPAGATVPATATLTAGSLAFVSIPASITFSATLNGIDQTATSNTVLDVGDATGSGAGWNIQGTSTTFTTGTHSLSNAATTIGGAPTDVCDTGATCTTGTNGTTYPYTLPAGATAPTATKLFTATANTGMGNQKVTPTWSLAIPGNAYSGAYSSTWTLSLVSGP